MLIIKSLKQFPEDKREQVPKQKLTIEITDIDGIHVDYMDVLEASQSEIC